jgi:orotate phosphoribosyltransferase
MQIRSSNIDEDYWVKTFTGHGAFWHHDGNPKRPYARLTSGKISNGFFNGGIITAYPRLLADVVRTLLRGRWTFTDTHIAIREDLHAFTGSNKDPNALLVIGPAMGAITIASRLAEELDVGTAYAEKVADNKTSFTFPRLPPKYHRAQKLLLTEDTITTGSSVVRVVDAARCELPDAECLPFVVALCNRSGATKIDSRMHICALIDRYMPTWDEGQNPFTPDGRELVPPVRPKTHWQDLTKTY